MPNWEYLREYVEASTIEEERGMLRMGTAKDDELTGVQRGEAPLPGV